MNRVQEAIAEAFGIRDSYEVQLHARESEFEQERSEWVGRDTEISTHMVEMDRAIEAVIADNRILARTLEDLDYLNLFEMGDKIREVLPSANSDKTLLRLRRLRHDNPIAKQGIRLIKRFTLGQGISWITKSDEVHDVLTDFWEDEDNKALLTTHDSMDELLDETATDGEKFVACYEAPNVAPYLKVADIPLEEVKDIIYDPENRRIPVYYKREFMPQKYDGTRERYETVEKTKKKVLFYRDFRISDEKLEDIGDGIKIPEKRIAKDADGQPIKMMHIYVNPLWTKSGKRGISELYASREWIRIFKEFMGDRAAINRAAMAIGYKRTVKGGPTAVAQISGKLGGLPIGSNSEIEETETRTLTRPVGGAIYDRNEAADLEWMKTDTGAANAKEDARMLLMMGGTGFGTNIHYFGEGGDANLATAQAMELPMVKNYEDWQTWLKNRYMEIFAYVLRLAFGEDIPFEEDATEATDLKIVASTSEKPAGVKLIRPEKKGKVTVWDVVSWDFPPIITKDVVKHMTAWAQMAQQIAPGNQVVKKEAIRGAMTVLRVPNVDQLMPLVEAEEARVEALKEEQRQAMMDNMANPDVGPAPKTNGKNGQGVAGFTKAGSGADAETKRLAKGKPPISRVGRVAADKRPGAG
jgi:hypothetical protein